MAKRSDKEINLAILSLLKDKTVIPNYNFFGDDNHKAIDYSIQVLKGEYTDDEIYELEENGELTEGERDIVTGVYDWMMNQGDELIDLLFETTSLVTELDNTNESEAPKLNVCAKMCNECPFSNKSLNGWLADYTTDDIIKFMSFDASFPCHKMIKKDLSVDEVTKAIEKGEMKLCRGYVEMLIKSAKSPKNNNFLVEAIKLVKEDGLSENSMSIFEFTEHHNKFKNK